MTAWRILARNGGYEVSRRIPGTNRFRCLWSEDAASAAHLMGELNANLTETARGINAEVERGAA